MKLTNTIRDSIVIAVMNDVPHEYNHEQALKDATSVAVELLPPAIVAIWNEKSTRHFVATRPYSRIQGYLPIVDKNPKIDAIADRAEASNRDRRKLRDHVRNVVYQFGTDTAMREHIPELDKYIPTRRSTTKNLPISSGLIDELTKAGFPNKVNLIKELDK